MPAGLVVRVLRRLLKPLLETGTVTFFVRDLQDDEHPVPSLPGIVVRQLQRTDKEALLHGADPARGWHALDARFDSSDLCFAALDEQGRALHTRWVTLSGAHLPELDQEFVPGPDAAYVYDAYTRPDARRRGLDSAVRRAVFGAMRKSGKRRVYSYARGDNPEGLRAAARHQRNAGTVRYLKVLRSRPFRFGIARTSVAALLR